MNEQLLKVVIEEGRLDIVFALHKKAGGLSEDEMNDLLHLACSEGNVLVLQSLINDGCNVNSVGASGCTPLMVAALHGHMRK